MNDELRPEYDLRELLKGGVRGKFTSSEHTANHPGAVEPDIAKAFPSDQAVNEALRLVLKLTQIPQVKEATASA